uniref:RNA-directed DNA polymerase n=1 Tax=Strongyloides stercoralis TaxID=6248 RepID=A0AAF5DLW8_STRER
GFINATTLSVPGIQKEYNIFLDSSFQKLGVALTQNEKIIAFVSRSLKPAEKNYPIKVKSCRIALAKNKELIGILQRYQMAILEYDLNIQYVKGKENVIIDYLSRESFCIVNKISFNSLLANHMNAEKVREKIKRIFYWPRMTKQITET